MYLEIKFINIKLKIMTEEKIRLIDILIESCNQGISGEWDCSTDEGKQGFEDMITLLERLKE